MKIHYHIVSSGSVELIRVVEPILIVDPILMVESISLEEPNPKRDTMPSILIPIPFDFQEVNVIPIPIQIQKNIGIITPLQSRSEEPGKHCLNFWLPHALTTRF